MSPSSLAPVRPRRPRIASLILAGALASISTSTASPVPASAESAVTLPSGPAVLARYLERTGGRAAYERHQSRVVTARVEIPAVGAAGKVTMWHVSPDRLLVVTDLPGLGTTEQGTDGKVAWERTSITGTRLLKGEEKAQFMRQATYNAELVPERLYTRIETVGTEAIDGKPHYKVALTPPEGRVVHQWFDIESGLLTQMTMTVSHQMGEIPSEARVSDYREIDGILVPYRTVTKLLQIEQVLVIEKVVQGEAVPPTKFDPPADVRALMQHGG